jgi:diguanylate cyclase (GGDEF)-like protein
MAIPVAGALVFPGWVAADQGMLLWTTSLVPAFLLAYYRGLSGVAIALAAGMALLSVTNAALLASGRAAPNWPLLLVGVSLYLGICIALGVVAELLHRERQAAERLALVDPLTGLPNRRHADLMLDAQFAAAGRGAGLAVVLFDLDHFKGVNDRHGHDAGDATLRGFAEVLKRNTRRMNLSARFGGEEFIAVLGDCPREGAVRFAERVRQDFRATPFEWGPVTASAGIALYEEGMGSHEVLVGTADRALYLAKGAGRDRVVVAEPATPPVTPSAPQPATVGPPSGPASVLVIDDDLSALAVVARFLRNAGYQVDATDAPDAVIARYRDGPVPDLLVSDVMMPRMSGLTLVDHLLQLRPDIRVVYMSGYLQRPVSWTGLPGAVAGFISKPIAKAELLEAVREALERTSNLPRESPAWMS